MTANNAAAISVRFLRSESLPEEMIPPNFSISLHTGLLSFHQTCHGKKKVKFSQAPFKFYTLLKKKKKIKRK